MPEMFDDAIDVMMSIGEPLFRLDHVIFTTSSVKTTPGVGARPSTRSSPKIACSTSLGAFTVAATRSISSRARSRLLTLTLDISQLPSPRNWAMAGGSNGYRAALVRRQLTPGLISSLPGTAGSPQFISFSTSYPEVPPMHTFFSNARRPTEGTRLISRKNLV